MSINLKNTLSDNVIGGCAQKRLLELMGKLEPGFGLRFQENNFYNSFDLESFLDFGARFRIDTTTDHAKITTSLTSCAAPR